MRFDRELGLNLYMEVASDVKVGRRFRSMRIGLCLPGRMGGCV